MNFTYWAISLFSVELHSNPKIGYFLSGLVELPALLLALALMLFFGRRTVTSLSYFGISLSMCFAVIFPGFTNLFFTISGDLFLPSFYANWSHKQANSFDENFFQIFSSLPLSATSSLRNILFIRLTRKQYVNYSYEFFSSNSVILIPF